jgi:transcriptional regulator with XRE-family HTH domain
MTTSKTKIGDETFISVDKALADVEQEITLGQMLRSLRKCESLKLSELAERMGVNKQFLSAVEHGKKQVGIDFIKQIARILDTPADSLLEIYFRDILRKHGLNMNVIIKKAS